MSGASQVGSCDAVHGYVAGICFKTGPPVTVGAELEWLVASPHDPLRPVPIDLLRSVLAEAGPVPGGSTVTFEPGGQLELSSPPAFGVAACWKGLQSDISHVEQVLADAGLALLWTAIDPYRQARRQLSHPRYDAMEAYFDRRGPEGRMMMCSTAAIQVNLDAGGDRADVARRWRLLHAIGPALVAAFANSPRYAGHATGWKSTRQAVWQRLDPRRTRAPDGLDPVVAWADYALDAPLMLQRIGVQRWVTDPGVTFRQWVDGNGHHARPFVTDLDYHLTTLFPPVRPRGWFEVRYIDAQPAAYWPVPVAVLSALVADPAAGEQVLAVTEPVADAWLTAARTGLADDGLARAARCCFETAIEGLLRDGVDPALVELVESYHDRYVRRRRCPADDDLAPLTLLSAKEALA
ncbi:MAG TPA: ergothioneine biosynthesis glutamate--cysteine ligase EgtA [Actinopolymorphaceae bacterium]|nr:ergothioneine biosynthesis glutamate--cysteine ligase EgtA [Actinopolymorphaceae bacterium]